MLKRFMNWLLHKLQNILGKKRGSSPAPSQPKRDADSRGPALGSNRTIGTSRPTVPVIDPISKPAVSPTPEPATATTEITEDPVINRSSPQPLVSDSTPELPSEPSDTHRRADVASAALPDIKIVSPAFPTEVSELMGSPLKPDESSATEANSADMPMRSLKRMPDGQLPGIHDLLPAVEATDLDEVPEPFNSESPLQPSSSLDTSSPDSTQATEPEQVVELEQATLFSFDIIEREAIATDERGDELLADESLEDEPLDESIAAAEAETAVEEAESPALPAQILIETEDDVADEAAIDGKVETLPYPWSLPVDRDNVVEDYATEDYVADIEPLAPPIEGEAIAQTKTFALPEAEQTTAPEAKQSKQSERSKSIAPVFEDRPVKNGVVKLLFTLKEGNFHGYIAPDDGTKDILFHQKYINADVFPRLERGVKVTAAIKYIEGKAYATRVDLQ